MSNKAIRRYFFAVQHGLCVYCGIGCVLDGDLLAGNFFTIDHIVPRALNGRGDRANLAGACHECNEKRSVAISRDSNKVLLRNFRLERDTLNRYRQLGPVSEAPAIMAMEHLEARPWAVHQLDYPAGRIPRLRDCCSECQGDLATGSVSSRTYCSKRCRSRARRRRSRNNRAARAAARSSLVHAATNAEGDRRRRQCLPVAAQAATVTSSKWKIAASLGIVVAAIFLALVHSERRCRERGAGTGF